MPNLDTGEASRCRLGPRRWWRCGRYGLAHPVAVQARLGGSPCRPAEPGHRGSIPVPGLAYDAAGTSSVTARLAPSRRFALLGGSRAVMLNLDTGEASRCQARPTALVAGRTLRPGPPPRPGGAGPGVAPPPL